MTIRIRKVKSSKPKKPSTIKASTAVPSVTKVRTR